MAQNAEDPQVPGGDIPAWLSGPVRIEAAAKAKRLQAAIDAGHLLDVRSVTGSGGRLVFSRHGDTLAVRLARPAAFHDTVRFTIVYRGKIENGRGLTFKKAEAGRAHYPQQIWSQGEADDNHRWFPTFDFPNDKIREYDATTLALTDTLRVGDGPGSTAFVQ